MDWGFSYVGLIYLAMLLFPNMIWARNLPKDYEKYAAGENKVLQAMERVGQAGVSCLVLISGDQDLQPWSVWAWWLVVSFGCMVLYEMYWVRYFRSPGTMQDFYSDLLGIPVAGASLPVAAFFLLAVYEKNVLLGLAVIFLGIGHIGIHWMHKKEICRSIEGNMT